jgi:hypothetical protein
LAAAGDTFAADWTTGLLAKRGRADEAIDHLRQSAAAGDCLGTELLADLFAGAAQDR